MWGVDMKQHIIADQINELTDKQKEQIRDMWDCHIGDIVIYNNDKYLLTGFDCGKYTINPLLTSHTDFWQKEIKHNECLPLLSIGEMIEILENEWIIVLDEKRIVRPKDGLCIDYATSTLCDALWEAVKQIL
jgi:hypothetical protein